MRFKSLPIVVAFSLACLSLLVSAGCGVAKDTQLQVKIKEILKADKNVAANKLIVNVMKGVVTISGELNTREEIDRVVQIVKAIPGVVEVKNQMSLPDNYNAVNPTFLDPFN